MSDQINSAEEENFEEISSDEVDRVVSNLEALAETVESENIRCYLEEAMNSIYYLVYDDEDFEDEVADAA
ncbi:MAG: hypothetical protein CMJ46_03780 [Planctomyces sp.]|nr:hypothetical protein [Planctomyces sp.]